MTTRRIAAGEFKAKCLHPLTDVTGATLTTRDRRILDYAAAGHVTAAGA